MKINLRLGVIVSLFLLLTSISAETVMAKENPLVIGIFPRRNTAATFKMFKPMAEYLSTQLGREVKIDTRKNFQAFWKQVEAGAYDIIHYNQYHYIKAHKKFGHEVIVRNVEMGSSLVGGAIFVNKASGFKTIKDLKGKEIVFGGGKGAMQSYIIATYLLRQGGLNDGDYIEKFAKNPPSAIKSVFFKQADACGSGDVVVQLPIVTKSINVDEVTMLAHSKRFPHLPWAVKGGMAPALRDKIRNIFISLKDSPEGRKVLKSAKLDGMVASTDSDFDPHRKIVKEIKGEEY